MSTTSSLTNHSPAPPEALSFTGGSSSDLPPRELQRIRQAIGLILGLLGLLVAARLWCLEGLLFPVPIAGASMADTLAGPHYRVHCADCGDVFRVDALQIPSSQEATCPNCGYQHNDLPLDDVRSGETVVVDRWVYLLGRPQRGDIVAFTHPNDKTRRVVKRIVGLPGEKIEIRWGDVYINGQPLRKNLAQLQAQATLVYDSGFPPKKTGMLPDHWQPAQPGSFWFEREQAYLFSGKTPPYEFAWLSFRYYRRPADPQSPVKFTPVLDDDAYNQADSRSLNDVTDLLLTCRASIAMYGCLVFAAVDGSDRFEVHLCHDEQKLKLFQNGKLTKVELLPHRDHDEPIDIQFALCDGRVLFGMDGRQVLAEAYQRQQPASPQIEPQLQIGGAGGKIRISQAKVWRDIYYLDPNDLPQPWEADRSVPPNHYFLLGDNPPVSDDSRQWLPAEVSRSAIIGRVIKPWWTQNDG